MTDAEHTLGPWGWGPIAEEPNRYRITANGNWLMSILHNGEQLTARQEANARLMAAAPELLEALKAMVAAHGGVSVMPTAEARAQNAASDKARAAIAKAEGRA